MLLALYRSLLTGISSHNLRRKWTWHICRIVRLNLFVSWMKIWRTTIRLPDCGLFRVRSIFSFFFFALWMSFWIVTINKYAQCKLIQTCPLILYTNILSSWHQNCFSANGRFQKGIWVWRKWTLDAVFHVWLRQHR